MPLSRRRFLGHTLTGSALAGLTPPLLRAGPPSSTTSDLAWLPGWQLRALVAGKQASPVEILEESLKRIEALDPLLGAFAEVDAERARAEARRAEKAALKGEALGPLHGVPVALKQMIAVEGLALEDGTRASRDAIATERLRRAGAIILGTTTLAGPAAMLGAATPGAANPWDTSRVAGASSSGAAASVAGGLCPIAIGSDGGGSTRLPAAWCGLVGMHPTVGRVPADDNLLRSQSRTSWSGTYGPLTRDTRDAAIVLSVIAGPHWRHIPSFNGKAPDYLHSLDAGVHGLRVAWTADLGAAGCIRTEDQPVVQALAKAARGFTAIGASVSEVSVPLGDWYPPFTRIAAELSAGPIYPLISGAARTWDKLRDSETAPQWAGDIHEALTARELMASQLLQLFGEFDILACPTSPRIAPRRHEYSRWMETRNHSPEYTCMTGHMNLLGFPAISVPAGDVAGMPVGLQLIAPPDGDALLLRAARALLEEFPPADARAKLLA